MGIGVKRRYKFCTQVGPFIDQKKYFNELKLLFSNLTDTG